MNDRMRRLAEMHGKAVQFSPALRRRLDEVRVSPSDLADVDALDRIPVLKKETLLELQAADPPFAGFLGCEIGEVGHVFVSPGPILEPLLRSDRTGHGMDRMFAAAGIGADDVALNSWAYHLVPAGLLFDRGLQAVGATVIPSGPGQTELQCSLIDAMRVTAFLGSTAYFETVAQAYRERFPDRPWNIRNAFLGGEFGEWTAKRKRIEAEYDVKIWSCYATADLGLVGYETADCEGYAIHEERLVQICDPERGTPLPKGEIGEIVVSTLNRAWPMLRFGTGDLAQALETDDDGFVTRLSHLVGRCGDAVKVREIFVYPRHIEQIAQRVAGIAEARAIVARQDGRERIAIEIRPGEGSQPDEVRIGETFRELTRLRPDEIRIVNRFTTEKTLEDRKDI